jgi:hypothetical protein
VVVPQTGQFFTFPQPLASTNNAVRRTVSRILDRIESPPAIFSSEQLQPALAYNQNS